MIGQHLHGVVFRMDPRKAASNLRKHGVSFGEAALLFLDPLARIFPDEENWIGEQREIIIGRSSAGRLLLVCFREIDLKRVRLISARPATRREQHEYERNAQG